MRRNWTIVTVLSIAALAAAGCGDDGGDDGASDDGSDGELSAEERGVGDDDRQALVEQFVAEGMPGQAAVCVIDELGLEEAQRLIETDEADLSDDEQAALAEELAACGAGEGTGGGGTGSAGAGAGDLGDVQACIEDAGLQVQGGSSAPDELNESLGIEDQLTIVSTNGGAGSVTLYASVEQADEALAAESELSGGDVAVGQFDTTVYVYAGAPNELAAVESCL